MIEGSYSTRGACTVCSCEAHGCEACVVCMIDVFGRDRESLRASRQEVRRERYEDRVLPWDVGGEA